MRIIKKNLLTLLVFIVSFGFAVPISLAGTPLETGHIDQNNDEVVKILAIGNSFSDDALEHYLFGLAKAGGKTVIIGNLYIGGASLDLHYKNAKGDLAAYDYRKIDTNGEKTSTKKTSIATALADEEWDYISFQQVSSLSGKFESFQERLPFVFNYVKERATNPEVKFVLHQTWAYAQNSTHDGFANYNNDQLTMYKAIVNTYNRAKNLVDIDIIVPAGTAIQNARTSSVGDNLTRDGYHLDLNIGRYTASCAWYEAIFEESVVGNSYQPDKLSEEEIRIAQKAAHAAVKKPKKITRLKRM